MTIYRKFLLLGVYCLIAIPLFSQNVFLELNLNNQTAHGIRGGFRSPAPRSHLEILRTIERAGRDNNIRGIILNISAFDSSRENMWELRSALEQFKSGGKKIYAFISNADMGLYTLASIADKIIMDEQGSLRLFGYAFGRGYVQHSLEKLGIGVRELRYNQYKSAMETFTRDSFSQADLRQFGEYLDDIFNYTRNTLKQARSWSDEEFETIINHEFLFSAQGALGRGLVDRLGRRDAIIEAIKELENKEAKRFVVFGDPASSIMKTSTAYRPPRTGGFFGRPPAIAIVYASGQTDMVRGMAARSLAQTIRELAGRRRVKAIVLRIDSPGGSAEAADYLAEAVRYAQQKKPVVVSMGRQAASGGYWAAVHANHITATPYTLTGSIGVIGSWFFDQGMNNRLGITHDVIQRGASADLFTGFILPRRDLRPEEEARFQSYILDIYRVFISRVAEGRGMSIEDVEAAAQGRVFSGQRALEAGLVDSIGGLWDAISIARNLAGIPEGKRVIYSKYPRLNFMDRLLRRFPAIAAFFGLQAAGNHGAAAFFTDFFFSEPLLADIRYRIERNGQAMPILPLGIQKPR